MKKMKNEKQHQSRPGVEEKMRPVPQTEPIAYSKKGKLFGKIALITGGDSGIGKAIALLFAKEGAHIAIAYLNEEIDALATKKEVENYNRECLLIKGDLSNETNCLIAVEKTIDNFKQIDIVVNNAALHWESESLEKISSEQLSKTFQNNVFSYFWITKYALLHMKKGGSIINTSSVTAYRGSPKLIDYAATKGAIVSFTRSLSSNLMARGIRVNAVAPGPVWTPLIVSSFDPEKVANFGTDSPMKRAGMPNEIAPSFLFLACDDSQFISGQVLHPNGGEIING